MQSKVFVCYIHTALLLTTPDQHTLNKTNVMMKLTYVCMKWKPKLKRA